MIDISFLRKDISINPFLNSGMEFMDWQENTTLFDSLAKELDNAFEEESFSLDLKKEIRENIEQIIKSNLNMTVNIVAEEVGNLSVDAGFINPGNLLNIPNIETWVKRKYSKVAEAYKSLNKDVIRGRCNTKNGRLEGDFAKIKFNININTVLNYYINRKELEKQDTTIGQALAALVIHECGHIWSGLLFIERKTIDNMLAVQAATMVLQESEPKARGVIIKETLDSLECKEEIPSDLDTISYDGIIVYFSKAAINRDARRAFSLGVSEMTSEVLADAYAVRFGCSTYLVKGLKLIFSQNSSYILNNVLNLIATYIFYLIFQNLAIMVAPLLVGLGMLPLLFTMAVGFVFYHWILLFRAFYTFFLTTSYVVDTLDSGAYDTPYRRTKTILRENIIRIETYKGSLSNKNKLIAQAKEMEKIVESNKSFLEGTFIQRSIGFIFNGSDFSRKNFEHYTAELAAHSIAINTKLRD